MRFAANLGWLFGELPFEARFEAAAQAGFRAVEYPSPYGYSAALLRTRLADAGLEQVLLNTPTGPPGSPERYGTACFPDRVREFRDGVLRALEYAVALDADVLHVVGGLRPEGVSRDGAFATYVANVAWAAAEAASTRVTLALEAINQRDAPGFVLDSVEQAAAVVREVGRERVGLLFDVYHCQVAQGDVTTRLRALMPLIAHLQVADAPDRSEPGTGEIGWSYVLCQIEALGYAGWVGCEYRPAHGTLAGLGWRERFSP